MFVQLEPIARQKPKDIQKGVDFNSFMIGEASHADTSVFCSAGRTFDDDDDLIIYRQSDLTSDCLSNRGVAARSLENYALEYIAVGVAIWVLGF